MWCTGAFVASSALNAFVLLLLRTQDSGNDNTWHLSGIVLAIHTLGVLQVFVSSGAYAYLQWAFSAPLLCWIVAQLVGTMPPGSGVPSAQRLYRIAILEVALALMGLLLMLTIDMPIARATAGVVSVTVLSLELLPLAGPHLLPYLRPQAAAGTNGGRAGGILAALLGSGGGGTGSGGLLGLMPRLSGGGWLSRPAASAGGSSSSNSSTGSNSMYASLGGSAGGWGSRLVPPRIGGGQRPGGGGVGSGAAGAQLPAPMEALLCAAAGGKVLQAVAAAAVGATAPGRGFALMSGGAATLPNLIWSLSTAITLYGLPLAFGMYYGLVRYAACMLAGRRSTLRRVSSLGIMVGGGGGGTPLSAAGLSTAVGAAASFSEEGNGAGGAPGGGGRGSVGSGVLPSMRRTAFYGAVGGGDSDSDSGMPAQPSRLLEVGELYRITESSSHSVSYSTSGDENWRPDLALTQLLYMARTTFHRRSYEDQRTADGSALAAGGTVAAGGGGAAGSAAAVASSRRSSPPPLSSPRPTSTACVQTEHRVSFGRQRSDMTVQCDIGPATIIKEVPVEVPMAVPGAAGGGGGGGGSGDGGPLMTLIRALREHSSDIAHDMKNPLNGVLALSQNVLQGTFGELPTAAADQLGVVRACAYHLLNMINQLRDCMRMLHGGEPDGNCGRVQLSNSIDEVLKRMSPMVGSRLTIRAEHDPSLIVFADDGRLYQTVHTVLANAFKYTRKGGVTIETALNSDKTAVTLRVVDTGSGFTSEQLDKFNSPLTGSPEEQLGLGLTMVKRTMAYFGGLLRLGNRSGGGGGGWVELTFRTKEDVPPLGAGLPPPPPAAPLPAAAAPPMPPPAPSAPAAAASGGGSGSAAAAAVTAAPPAAVKKLRKSHMGSGSGAGAVMEERLSVENSSNDRSGGGAGGGATCTGGGAGRGPSSTATGLTSGTGAPAAARGGGAGSTALMGAGLNDDALTGKSDEPVRVLIVDDDPVNLTILEDLLRAEGYDVLTAASGTEALEVYLTSDPQPKLVLLDVTLPDMSGHEVCLKMRSLTPGVPPPIIMISGKASTKDVIKGLQAGACDYITKPFQPQEVMARVETQLRLFMGEVAQLQEAAERNMALLRQILPPHILASLRGGTRVLVEKFSDVVVLAADVVGFSALAAAADTADCILTLNRLFSTFDTLTDKLGVHKMDCHTDSYVAALGHMPQDRHISNVMQVKTMLDLAREMLAAVDSLPYPDTLGKMQIRIGLHVGAVYGGVIGVKYPRYSLFGTTLRLAQALQATALPNTIHVTEVVHNRVRSAGGETFMPYTTSQVQSLGIIRTFLAAGGPDGNPSPGMLDYSRLDSAVALNYLRSATAAAHGITILNCLLGPAAPPLPAAAADGASSGGGGIGMGIVSRPMVMGGRPALGAGPTALPPPLEATASLGGGAAVAAAAVRHASVAGDGGGGGGGVRASGSGYKIIPVISNMHLGGGGAGAGGGGGGPPSSMCSGGAGVGSAGAEGSRPSRSGESDGSGFTVTLAHVHQMALDTGGQEVVHTLAAAASGDVSNLMSMDMAGTTAGLAAPPGASIATASASASSASGAAISAAGGILVGGAGAAAAGGPGIISAVHNYAGVGVTSFSGSGSVAGSVGGGGAAAVGTGGRRQTSDASLVQDLSPGPPAAGLSGLTRMQRMHAGGGSSGSRQSGSGAVSPRPGGSRIGSCGPSRNTSFQLGSGGLGGGGGTSPLAATLMHQQLLTALQQQQQQAQALQQQQQLQPPVAGLAATAAALSTTEESISFVADLGDVSKSQSTSEPLLRLDPTDSGAADSAADASCAGHPDAGRGGLSSATMRRMHMPLKAASSGALPGGGGCAATVVGSTAGSVSAGGMSTAGSLGSPPLLFSPTAQGPPVYGVPGAAAVIGAASPYAGLSSETRARLARLRTASQPDLQETTAAMGVSATSMPYVSAAGVTAATAAIGATPIDPILAPAPNSGDAVFPVVLSPVAGEYGTGLGFRYASTGASQSPFQPPVRFSSGLGGGGIATAANAGVPQSPVFVQRPPQQRRPSTVSELLDSLGLAHYSRSISGAVSGGLDELASLDDGGLRKVGLVSSRSRQLVRDELTRWGYK